MKAFAEKASFLDRDSIQPNPIFTNELVGLVEKAGRHCIQDSGHTDMILRIFKMKRIRRYKSI